MRSRFAPSPTGPLHLGHAYSALLAHDMARAAGGDFILRIEDIDRARARPEWEELIYDDLHWLGIAWEMPVMRQSERLHTYANALEHLWNKGLLFACVCNRRDIQEAISAPQEGSLRIGPDGIVYPGTCRKNRVNVPSFDALSDRHALRLAMDLALDATGDLKTHASFTETGQGPEGDTGQITVSADDMIDGVGDIVLARRDMGTSYHLSVVLDDAAQGITHIVRGEDLFDATKIHVVLQKLLGLPTPIYHHHRLIRDEAGKRLAKRDDARSIRTYRDDGASPEDIRRMVGLEQS